MVIREYEGRTEREAVKRAVEDLGVSGEKLKIEVITEKSKFFSFGSTVRIRVYLDDLEDTVSNKVGNSFRVCFKRSEWISPYKPSKRPINFMLR